MFLINAEHQNIQLGEGALFSIVAILIVFIVLVLIIACVTLLSKVKFKEKEVKQTVAPVMAASTKKLTIDDIKDEDMMVAALVATAEYVEETKEKDARLVSIKQIG